MTFAQHQQEQDCEPTLREDMDALLNEFVIEYPARTLVPIVNELYGHWLQTRYGVEDLGRKEEVNTRINQLTNFLWELDARFNHVLNDEH